MRFGLRGGHPPPGAGPVLPRPPRARTCAGPHPTAPSGEDGAPRTTAPPRPGRQCTAPPPPPRRGAPQRPRRRRAPARRFRPAPIPAGRRYLRASTEGAEKKGPAKAIPLRSTQAGAGPGLHRGRRRADAGLGWPSAGHPLGGRPHTRQSLSVAPGRPPRPRGPSRMGGPGPGRRGRPPAPGSGVSAAPGSAAPGPGTTTGGPAPRCRPRSPAPGRRGPVPGRGGRP